MTAAAERQVRGYRMRAVRRYTAGELTGLFFAFSALGWLWEVGLHLVLDGELVNRGTMLGPVAAGLRRGRRAGRGAAAPLRRPAAARVRVGRAAVHGGRICRRAVSAGGIRPALVGLQPPAAQFGRAGQPAQLGAVRTGLLRGGICCGTCAAARFARLDRRHARALCIYFALRLCWILSGRPRIRMRARA